MRFDCFIYNLCNAKHFSAADNSLRHPLISVCRYLYGNPFNCDCELSWLPAFLRNVPETGFIPPTCATPAILTGRNILTLPESLFICKCLATCEWDVSSNINYVVKNIVCMYFASNS